MGGEKGERAMGGTKGGMKVLRNDFSKSRNDNLGHRELNTQGKEGENLTNKSLNHAQARRITAGI